MTAHSSFGRRRQGRHDEKDRLQQCLRRLAMIFRRFLTIPSQHAQWRPTSAWPDGFDRSAEFKPGELRQQMLELPELRLLPQEVKAYLAEHAESELGLDLMAAEEGSRFLACSIFASGKSAGTGPLAMVFCTEEGRPRVLKALQTLKLKPASGQLRRVREP